jgi:polyisoprenoid-binding protein YceI
MVRHFGGEVRFDPAANTASSLRLAVKTGSLESVDDLDARSRQIINGNVRGHVLEAAKYPEITFVSTQATTSPGSVAGHYTAEIDGDLTLHGVTRPQHITADVSVANHWLHASGVLRVRQTDHNIKPETLVGGLIKVEDEVHLVFEIDAYQPVRLNGMVQRHYTDRAGFVSAIELEPLVDASPNDASPNDAPPLVRFHPGLGQELSMNNPVDSEAMLWVRENRQRARPHWDFLAWQKGSSMPRFGKPYLESDTDWLKAQPYIAPGAQYQTIKGQLQRTIVGDSGEVLGLLLRGADGNETLVIVPPEMRHITTVPVSAPLTTGAQVVATGWPVAPRSGSVSMYDNYIAATAVVINGKSAGASTFSQTLTPPSSPYEPVNAQAG